MTNRLTEDSIILDEETAEMFEKIVAADTDDLGELLRITDIDPNELRKFLIETDWPGGEAVLKQLENF